MANNKNRTQTSNFGISGRHNRNSNSFYNSKLYANQEIPEPDEWIDNSIPDESVNTIYCKSSRDMSEIPDSSIHLMVTSPPYNVKKEYDDDLSIEEYRELLFSVFEETYSKLATGGRACINIANVGRKPYMPLHVYIIEDMLSIGYHMRGEIIWNKGASAGSSTAWGSWMSAANPVLRDVHEYILVFSKDSFHRSICEKSNSIERDDFLEWTKSVWSFPTVSAKRIGHPAPFPEELPRRLIEMYSFVSDIVLDPFCGSGTTCLSALKCKRNYIGYDINQEYVELANDRIDDYVNNPELPFDDD